MGSAWRRLPSSLGYHEIKFRQFSPTRTVIALRILLDHNIPIGVRSFLPEDEVFTVIEMDWPAQIENGELLTAAGKATFDVLITSDQNIRHQQNLALMSFAFVVLGSNIWPVVRTHRDAIVAAVQKSAPGGVQFIEMPLPRRPQKRYGEQ